MEEQHKYRVVAWWTSGRTGTAKSDSAPNSIHFTAPPEFGGLEGRWTPEDLLLGAVASCLYDHIPRNRGIRKIRIQRPGSRSGGHRAQERLGLQLQRNPMRPTLMISSEQDQGRALGLLRKAKALCMVSRALATAPKLEVRVQVSKLLPVG